MIDPDQPVFFLSNRAGDEEWIVAPNAEAALDRFTAQYGSDSIVTGQRCKERTLCARCGGSQASLGASYEDRDTPGGEGPCGDIHRWITVAHHCRHGRLNVAIFDGGRLTHDGIVGPGLPLRRFPIGAQPYISELMNPETTFRNLTPHRVTIFPPKSMDHVVHIPTARVISAAEAANCPPGELHYPESWHIEPDETPARVEVHEKPISVAGDVYRGIPLSVVDYGDVTGLPAPVLGTIYIVSYMVRMACPDRYDLASPGELVRDKDGRPIGCKTLHVTHDRPQQP
jgi:hypothetical protein